MRAPGSYPKEKLPPREKSPREVELENRIKKLEKWLSETEKLAGIIQSRTHYDGQPPYAGWDGYALALREAFDERDAYKIALEEIRDMKGAGTLGKAAGNVITEFSKKKG